MGIFHNLFESKEEKEKRREERRQAEEKARKAKEVEALINALKDSDKDVRREAATALGKLQDARAVEPLIVALNDRHIRTESITAMGLIGDARAIEPLAATLNDEGGDARYQAIIAFGAIGDKKAIDFLAAYLQDKDQTGLTIPRAKYCNYGFAKQHRIYDAAVESLEKLGWKPDKSDAGITYWLSKGEWERCVDIGETAIDGIISALGRYKNEKYPLEDYDSSDYKRYSEVRNTAFNALGHIGSARVVEILLSIALQGDVSDGDASRAAYTLGEIGDARVIKPLLSWLEQFYLLLDTALHSRMPNQRVIMSGRAAAIASTLGKLRATQAGELLMKYLELSEKSGVSDGGSIRPALIFALGELGEARAVRPIYGYAEPGSKIGELAVEALGKIADPYAVECLISLITSKIGSYTIGRALKAAAIKSGDWVMDEVIALGANSKYTDHNYYNVINSVPSVLKVMREAEFEDDSDLSRWVKWCRSQTSSNSE